MTPSEFAFLALGLVLGSAVGAAIAQSLARRPGPRREIRVTITPNAIPSRRGYTLAMANGFSFLGGRADSADGPVLPDGPDESPTTLDGLASRTAAAAANPPRSGPQTRTLVPSAPTTIPATAISIPVMTIPAPTTAGANDRDPHGGRSGPTGGGASVAGLARPVAVGHSGAPVLASPVVAPSLGAPAVAMGIAVLEPAEDRHPGVVAPIAPTHAAPPSLPASPPVSAAPSLTAAPTFTTLVRPRRPVEAARPVLVAASVAVPVVRPLAIVDGDDAGTGTDSTGGTGVQTEHQATAADPCAPARRLVDERCALADVARAQARSAADGLREAQRVYDVLRERVDLAQTTADPRQVAAAKARLHAEFRAASDDATGPDETEAAARSWLNHINELNAAVREAQRVLDAGNAELRAQVPVLDRLAADADAARISGENAEAGCREAREELASCEETAAHARAALPPPPADPDPFEGVWPDDGSSLPERQAPGEFLAGLPPIVRILRGDRDARQQLVASLAAGDAEAEREWQLRVARLVDAITARAIEDGYLDVPDDDPFWRLFERREARDIVSALSALGYRYDGMGGFADGRVPAARDLSLAVGYAGLDRMRIRTWPREAEIAALYERAVVSSDEWLADQADDLSLGRMVDALGGRAAELADIWNAWGRVRPALLDS